MGGKIRPKKSKVSNLKIAIVEDDPELCILYGRAIQELGYHAPSLFYDGTSIVRAMTKDREYFDVILMDYRMPEMNGIEAAKIIHRHREKATIIILSAYDHGEKEASELGFPFLRKPYSLQQLATYLESRKKDMER